MRAALRQRLLGPTAACRTRVGIRPSLRDEANVLVIASWGTSFGLGLLDEPELLGDRAALQGIGRLDMGGHRAHPLA